MSASAAASLSMSNCKVHLVIDNDVRQTLAMRSAGANYALFSAYQFIATKKQSYATEITPNWFKFNHVIVDSGLFTLMFGAKKDQKLEYADLYDWMQRLAQFANENDVRNASWVECDSQKLVGAEATWEIRREFERMMGEREVINVFHLEDGPDGFDRLVDHSRYIAISVPELRINRPKKYKQIASTLARRARMLKPDIKIHLLGCTEPAMLAENSFVTSADSSSWLSWARYGWAKGKNAHHVSQMHDDMIEIAVERIADAARMYGIDYAPATQKQREHDASKHFNAVSELAKYRKACGPQD